MEYVIDGFLLLLFGFLILGLLQATWEKIRTIVENIKNPIKTQQDMDFLQTVVHHYKDLILTEKFPSKPSDESTDQYLERVCRNTELSFLGRNFAFVNLHERRNKPLTEKQAAIEYGLIEKAIRIYHNPRDTLRGDSADQNGANRYLVFSRTTILKE